ncbi:MAG: (deoxy)nucleoside triphosphate pyrophosphohydrolase [Acidobacteria bacterium]|nr:(deoxy)nucleoside triphosphate pyrophosphohydrolase [Acidobacteriota bacterium]
MQKTVVAALLFQEGRILICQRAAGGPFAGKWEFPGGKVESGEHPKAALCRELQEELGITAQVRELIWQAEHQYSGHAPFRLLFFAISAYGGTINNAVFQQICWATPQELPHYDFLAADLPLVQKLARGEIIVPHCEIIAQPEIS